MDNLLEGRHSITESRIEQLNCLIYKNGEIASDEDVAENLPPEMWQAEKENVSVRVWEDKAKIKFRVSQGKTKRISLKRIAKVAVDAILEELKKED